MFDELEIRWRQGEEWHRLVMGADGRGHIEDGVAVPRERSGPPRKGPARKGQAWTEEEEDAVAFGVATVEDAPRIAQELGRSTGAVLARAVKLGILDPSDVTLRFGGGQQPS